MLCFFFLQESSFGDELYNLDNDSFLNSLETMPAHHPVCWGTNTHSQDEAYSNFRHAPRGDSDV